MSPIDLAYFGIPMLLAFALLINWKWRRWGRRRAPRESRSAGLPLRLFVALPEEGDDAEEELIVA